MTDRYRQLRPSKPVNQTADQAFQVETKRRWENAPTAAARTIERVNRDPELRQALDDVSKLTIYPDKAPYPLASLYGVIYCETSARGGLDDTGQRRTVTNDESGASGPFQVLDTTYWYNVKKYGPRGLEEIRKHNPAAADAFEQAIPNITIKGNQVILDAKTKALLAPYKNIPFIQAYFFVAHAQAHNGLASNPEQAWSVNVLGAEGAAHLALNLPKQDPKGKNQPHAGEPPSDPNATRADRNIDSTALASNFIAGGVSVASVTQRFVKYYNEVVAQIRTQLDGESPAAVAANASPAAAPPPAASAPPAAPPPAATAAPPPAAVVASREPDVIPLDGPPAPKPSRRAMAAHKKPEPHTDHMAARPDRIAALIARTVRPNP